MASIRKKAWQTKRGERSAWIVEWRDQNGRPKSKSHDSKREADRHRREVEGRQDAGERTAVEERVTAGDWMADYAKRAHVSGIDGGEAVGAARRNQLDWVAKRIQSDRIGGMLLEEITEPDMRKLRDRLLRSDLERKSAKEVLSSFKAALDDARRQGLVLADVWQDVKIVVSSRRRRRVDDDGDDYLEMPNREQVRKLLATAKGLRDDTARTMGWEPDADAGWRRYHESGGPRGWKNTQQAWRRNYAFVLLAILTGLRQGEIRALYKRDVDFEAGVIRVRRAADVDNNLKEPKTESGIRVVPMPDQLADELRAWLEIAPESRLLFPNRKGDLLDRSNVYHRIWCQLLKYAGMGEMKLSFHALRHFYASGIIAAGMNPKRVMETMGHSSIQVTFDLYGHLFDQDMVHVKAASSQSADTLLAG